MSTRKNVTDKCLISKNELEMYARREYNIFSNLVRNYNRNKPVKAFNQLNISKNRLFHEQVSPKTQTYLWQLKFSYAV